MSEISTAARRELVQAISGRYRTVSADEKGRILDEFVALTGYHRKHAIRVLNGFTGTPTSTRRGRLRLYDEAVRQALIVFWEASDRICGKRLKPLLPVLLPALERHGHISLDPAVRAHLLAVSASTIDRMLSGARASTGGRRARAKTTPAVRRRVPVRTFADWHEPAPGFVEADLVVHCGESMAGSFASTLVLTDIASGWIECIALLVRDASLIVDAFERLRVTLPFPLRGIDTDNGSEFINELLIKFCTDHGIEFTRSRPYRKNDQAWVEQEERFRRAPSRRLRTAGGRRGGRGALA
ncbi:MAG: integrase catalytic domain-containing protein, partial [Tepidisphaeraceae bacterium]